LCQWTQYAEHNLRADNAPHVGNFPPIFYGQDRPYVQPVHKLPPEVKVLVGACQRLVHQGGQSFEGLYLLVAQDLLCKLGLQVATRAFPAGDLPLQLGLLFHQVLFLKLLFQEQGKQAIQFALVFGGLSFGNGQLLS